MKNTKQNNLILNIINDDYTHPTAKQLYEKCRKQLPNISLGTVYRNLNDLVEKGCIKRIKCTDNNDRYDRLDKDNTHSHFICYKCHSIIDIFENYKIPKLNNSYKVIDYEINYRGICPKCQKEGEDYGIKRN